MKTLIAATFIATLGFAGAAQAMPVAPLSADTAVEQVAQGCGPGMRRNAAGRCRPAFMLRGCRPGFRKNRFGICRPMRG
jgi:hypothetical protein